MIKGLISKIGYTVTIIPYILPIVVVGQIAFNSVWFFSSYRCTDYRPVRTRVLITIIFQPIERDTNKKLRGRYGEEIIINAILV